VLVWVAGVSVAGVSHAGDCNQNGLDDAEDITTGRASDCNGDGIPDICEALPAELGQRREAAELASKLRVLAVGDFDGDGLADTIAGSQVSVSASQLAFRRGHGDGTFGAALPFEAPAQLTSLASADFDQDGDLDLATAHFSRLLAFENLGDGAFREVASVDVPRSTSFVTAADVDGNGLPDLVGASTGEDVVVLATNSGAWAFAMPLAFPAGDRPTHVVATDLNGDQRVDLAVAARDSDSLSILLQSEAGIAAGSPKFDAPIAYGVAGLGPTRVIASDVNRDGHADLLVSHEDGVSLAENSGAGSFTAKLVHPVSTLDIHVLDIDRDGYPDLLLPEPFINAVTLLRNNREGGFLPPQSFATELLRGVLTDADVDGDGESELIVERPETGELAVLWQGERNLAPALDEVQFPYQWPPHSLTTADFNADGLPDLAAVNGGRTSASVFLALGGGTVTPTPGEFLIPGANHASFVTAADVDDDGHADLLIADRGAHLLHLLLGDGTGEFVAATESYEVGVGSNFAAAADVDGDGRTDILSANPSAGTVTIRYQGAEGSFARRVDIASGAGATSLATGDMDRDGRLDIVVANRDASTVSVFLGPVDEETANEGAVPSGTYAVDRGPVSIVLTDLNRNGQLDLATANGGGGSVSVLLGEPSGIFGAESRFSMRASPRFLAAADLDRNGLPDLLTANESNNSVSVLLATAPGSYAAVAARYPVGRGPRTVLALDFDQDGDLDLAVPDRGNGDKRPGSVTVALQESALPPRQVDSLSSVCTGRDFLDLATAVEAYPPLDASCLFLLPVAPEATLTEPTFINARRFDDARAFLSTRFPEHFGDLGTQEYEALVAQRATRRYFTGQTRRLRLGASDAYAIELVTRAGDPSELPTLEEVHGVLTQLAGVFLLSAQDGTSLGYRPRGAAAREAAAAWDNPGFPVYLFETSGGGEEPPPLEGAPTFELRIPDGLEICGTFAESTVDRGITEEHRLKSRVRLRGGTIELPTTMDSFATELFEEVRFGAAEELAEPVAPGEFERLRIPATGGGVTYRFTYSQAFALADGRRLDLALVAPLVFSGRGDEALDGPAMWDDTFFTVLTGREAIQAELDGVPLVRYGSCTYPTLPEIEVSVELEDGTRLLLTERFREADSVDNTAAAILARADVDIGTERQEVRDYFRLVYSALRHNAAPVYWVLLDPPVRVEGLSEVVHGIEFASGDAPEIPATAAYLGSALEVLAHPAVRQWSRSSTSSGTSFRRGDVDASGTLAIVDALDLLEHLFRRGDAPSCRKAADANDDGRLDLIDAITLLEQLFGRQEVLPPPYPACGPDPSGDSLTCRVFPACA